MEGRHPIELVRCGKRRVNGLPCQQPAIHGGHVCRIHGGAAPQVVADATLRLPGWRSIFADTLAAAAANPSKASIDKIVRSCEPFTLRCS